MTEIWRDREEETIRLYPSSVFLLTSLQMTRIHVGDISILDGQVRFVKFEKRVDTFCITNKLPVQITKIFILIYSFRRAC
jgi:predicted phosphatase